jgi:hypothetical protein
MDQVTQQNAALVEEAAAAAESMQDQAARLSEVVSVFKLNAGAGTARAATVTARKPLATPVRTPAPTRVALATKKPAKQVAGGDEWEQF